MSGNLSATVATLLFRPAAGTMEITPLPAINSEATIYRLEMESAVRAMNSGAREKVLADA
jgi:isopenicillin-N N-acyltransferase-like protein